MVTSSTGGLVEWDLTTGVGTDRSTQILGGEYSGDTWPSSLDATGFLSRKRLSRSVSITLPVIPPDSPSPRKLPVSCLLCEP